MLNFEWFSPYRYVASVNNIYLQHRNEEGTDIKSLVNLLISQTTNEDSYFWDDYMADKITV